MNGRFRVKCPRCGHVQDINGPCGCVKCSAELKPQPGEIRMYRMGNFVGAAGGFGVYIDEQPFGTHKIHVAAGMNRKCTDMLITLSPEAPVGFLKVRMKVGFLTNKFIIEPSMPEEMPPL